MEPQGPDTGQPVGLPGFFALDGDFVSFNNIHYRVMRVEHFPGQDRPIQLVLKKVDGTLPLTRARAIDCELLPHTHYPERRAVGPGYEFDPPLDSEEHSEWVQYLHDNGELISKQS